MKSKLPHNLQTWFNEYLQLSTTIAATSALSQQSINGTTPPIISQSVAANNESLSKFVQKSKSNASLFTSVDTILADLATTKSLGNDSIELSRSLLSNILLFYRSLETPVQLIALEFLPNVLSTYAAIYNQHTRSQSNNQNQDQSSNHLTILVTIFESFLLGVYNVSVQRWPNLSSSRCMRIPLLSDSTVYNPSYNTQQPPGLLNQSMSVPVGSNLSGSYTFGDLSPPLKLDGSSDNVLNMIGGLNDINVSQPSFHSMSRITAETRAPLLRLLISRLNQDIDKMTSRAHLALCQFALQITDITNRVDLHNTTTSSIHRKRSPSFVSRKLTPNIIGGGSNKENNSALVKLGRFPIVSADLLVELTSAAYFIMFNGHTQKALETLNSIEQRACYDFIPEVLLVVNGIKNSLESNPSGAPSDGPMGISVIVSRPLIDAELIVDSESLLLANHNHQDETDHSSFLVPHNNSEQSAAVSGATISASSPASSTVVAGSVSNSGAAARARFRSIITNASFKTIKLPDDIPIKASGSNQTNPHPMPRPHASRLREETIPEIVGADDVDIVIPSVNSSSHGGKSFANKLRNLRKPGSKDSNVTNQSNPVNNGIGKEAGAAIQPDEASRFSVHSDT